MSTKILNRSLKITGEKRKVGASGTVITVQELNATNHITRAFGPTVPTDGDAGYSVGCLFTDTDASTGAVMYVNEGTVASCDFNIGVPSGGDITAVVAGAGLTGGATSGSATLNVVNTDGKITVGADSIDITAGSLVNADINASAAIAGSKLALTGVITPAMENVAEAVTATALGDGTGLIAVTARFVTVTCDDATKIVTLPASAVGKSIKLWNGATGYEIRTTAASSIKINDVVSGSTNELAIPANTLVTAVCVSATEWNVTALTKLGAVVAALVPDAV
jgi:hypothetical protein